MFYPFNKRCWVSAWPNIIRGVIPSTENLLYSTPWGGRRRRRCLRFNRSILTLNFIEIIPYISGRYESMCTRKCLWNITLFSMHQRSEFCVDYTVILAKFVSCHWLYINVTIVLIIKYMYIHVYDVFFEVNINLSNRKIS